MAGKPAWSIGARQGPLRRHKQMVYFACEGLIVVIDERPGKDHEGDYIVLRPSELEERARALAQFVKGWRTGTPWQRQEHQLCTNAADEMLEAVKEARHMGDPSDPAVQAFWARHRGRKSTVSLRAGTDAAGYPTLPKLPKGKQTGKTAKTDRVISEQEMAEVNTAHLGIHRPPRRKNRKGLILEL